MLTTFLVRVGLAAVTTLALVGCGSIAPTCDQPITIGYGDADGDG